MTDRPRDGLVPTSPAEYKLRETDLPVSQHLAPETISVKFDRPATDPAAQVQLLELFQYDPGQRAYVKVGERFQHETTWRPVESLGPSFTKLRWS